MSTFQTWRRALTTRWDADRAERLVTAAENRCAVLRRDEPRPTHPRLGRHLDELILPGFALYRELLAAGLSRDESLGVVTTAIAASAEPERRRFAWLSRVPFFFLVMRSVIRGYMSRNFPLEGWDVDWVELSSRRIAWNIRRCFYCDTLLRLEAPELTPLFCGYDDVVYGTLSPSVRWQRTQTLARGGTLCDFRFERVES